MSAQSQVEQPRVVSVCRSLPTPDDPSSGIFVLNRIAAMARQAPVQALQPVPYCPVVAPLPTWARAPRRVAQGMTISHAPMFYLPGVLKRLDGMWLQRSIATQLRTLRAKAELDIIDAHFGYPEGVGCVAAAKELGVPVFVTVRGFENEFAERGSLGKTMLAALRSADGCIAVSHFLKDFLVRNGVDETRVRVIHNAIDSAIFSYDEPAAARARLNLSPQQRVIVSVGHLVSRKRHHVLIDAIARLPDRSNILLAIIGSTSFERDYPQMLRDVVARHGLQDNVRFAGNIKPKEVAEWLRAADLFALGTAREGCCNSILEALACGAPVVTTPAGDNAYFVRNDVNGAIVPIDDAGTMSVAVDQVLKRAWDRRSIAAELAAQVGSWEGVASRALEFIRAPRKVA